MFSNSGVQKQLALAVFVEFARCSRALAVVSLHFSQQLRRLVDERQAKLGVAKAEYRAALRNLESISEEIHAHRRSLAMGTREQGVGAEGDGGDEDITSFKVESDGLSSECNGNLSQIM